MSHDMTTKQVGDDSLLVVVPVVVLSRLSFWLTELPIHLLDLLVGKMKEVQSKVKTPAVPVRTVSVSLRYRNRKIDGFGSCT